MNQTSVIDRERDPYRWRCPNGHTSWWLSDDHERIICGYCQSLIWEYRAVGSGPEHDKVRDATNGGMVPVTNVEVVGSE